MSCITTVHFLYYCPFTIIQICLSKWSTVLIATAVNVGSSWHCRQPLSTTLPPVTPWSSACPSTDGARAWGSFALYFRSVLNHQTPSLPLKEQYSCYCIWSFVHTIINVLLLSAPCLCLVLSTLPPCPPLEYITTPNLVTTIVHRPVQSKCHSSR